eukprot:ctg_174.g116
MCAPDGYFGFGEKAKLEHAGQPVCGDESSVNGLQKIRGTSSAGWNLRPPLLNSRAWAAGDMAVHFRLISSSARIECAPAGEITNSASEIRPCIDASTFAAADNAAGHRQCACPEARQSGRQSRSVADAPRWRRSGTRTRRIPGRVQHGMPAARRSPARPRDHSSTTPPRRSGGLARRRPAHP